MSAYMIVALIIATVVMGSIVSFVLTRPQSWFAPDGVYQEVRNENQ